MGKIVIIGPRSSGKTTYLAGLAHWPSLNQKSIYSVEKGNKSVNQLQAIAENLLMLQEDARATDIPADKKLDTYSFYIDIKQKWGKSQRIELAVKDYPGELFHDLENHSFGTGMKHPEFWKECFKLENDGCLILFPEGFELLERDEENILRVKKADQEYRKCMSGFFRLMDQYRKDKKLNDNFRLAVAMSKCERGELWPGRLEPEIDLFGLYLKRTTQEIKRYFDKEPKNLRFYAISTFGVLNDREKDRRPNCQLILGENNRSKGVLKNPDQWQPYNLIAPLYWLSTGKTINNHAR